jgi:hypothetical protein
MMMLVAEPGGARPAAGIVHTRSPYDVGGTIRGAGHR